MLGGMIDVTRRRTKLGKNTSAAIVLIWAEMARRGWSDARLGAEMREDSGAVSRLLYGDRKANREQARWFLENLGTPLASWDERCPARRRRHVPIAVPDSTTAIGDPNETIAKAG